MDTIRFDRLRGMKNRIPISWRESDQIRKIIEILSVHRQQGINIVLYVNKKVNYDGLSGPVTTIGEAWNSILNEPRKEGDQQTQLKLWYDQGMFTIQIEICDGYELDVPFETTVNHKQMVDVLTMLLTTKHIYDCYEDPILL